MIYINQLYISNRKSDLYLNYIFPLTLIVHDILLITICTCVIFMLAKAWGPVHGDSVR